MSLNTTLHIMGQDVAHLKTPMTSRPVVYVAGYYSANPIWGTRNAIDRFDELVPLGCVPLIPHSNLLLDIVTPHNPAFWYEYDLALLSKCDAMFVCSDEATEKSTGVKREIDFAFLNNIPVFYNYALLANWIRGHHAWE